MDSAPRRMNRTVDKAGPAQGGPGARHETRRAHPPTGAPETGQRGEGSGGKEDADWTG